MVRSTTFTLALGLLSLASMNMAAPLDSRQDREGGADDTATKVKIMPFGASIVEITCWRAYLWQKLQTAGITNVDFVGSHATPSGNCTLSGVPVPFDKDNEGHSGARVTDYASKNQLPPWLSAAKPDIILMHVGTNDAVANISSADVIAAYDTLLGQMRASNPRNVLLVSKLIPIDPKLFGQGVSDRIVEYNGAMEGWVEKVNTGQSPVVLVDMFTGFDVGSMTREGEHPNEKGDVFFAEKFFPVLKDQLVRVTVEDMMRRLAERFSHGQG